MFWQTSLLCIVGELAEGGYVAVALGGNVAVAVAEVLDFIGFHANPPTLKDLLVSHMREFSYSC